MKKYKWTKQEKDKVEKLIQKYKKKLHLTSWVVYSTFIGGYPTAGDPQRGNDFVSFAQNTITPAYEKIDIVFFPALLREIREMHKTELEDTVKHELCHCLTQELYEVSLTRHSAEKDCVDAVERLTQRISQLI